MVIVGVTDPTTLEAIACREGLVLVDDLLLGNLIIATDCKQVVDDINNGNQGSYGSVITEIKMRSLSSICNFVLITFLFYCTIVHLGPLLVCLLPYSHILIIIPSGLQSSIRGLSCDPVLA